MAAEKAALNLPLTTRDRHRGGDLPHLQLTLAWGCVAECIVSILCPVSIVGVLDLSATALNVIGPFIAGVVHAFDESLNDTRWPRYCAAFQAGFVGVFTFTVTYRSLSPVMWVSVLPFSSSEARLVLLE